MTENMANDELLAMRSDLIKKISSANNRQMAIKIL